MELLLHLVLLLVVVLHGMRVRAGQTRGGRRRRVAGGGVELGGFKLWVLEFGFEFGVLHLGLIFCLECVYVCLCDW